MEEAKVKTYILTDFSGENLIELDYSSLNTNSVELEQFNGNIIL